MQRDPTRAELSDAERILLGYLHRHCRGAARARTYGRLRADLEREAGLAIGEREMYALVASLVLKCRPVGTTPAGAYVWETPRDVRLGLRNLVGRVIHQHRRIRAYKGVRPRGAHSAAIPRARRGRRGLRRCRRSGRGDPPRKRQRGHQPPRPPAVGQAGPARRRPVRKPRSGEPALTMMDETTNIEKPRIGALAPWFGAKRILAPEIVRELGPHRAYWEPFCGSCAVLFAKPALAYETVNDLHQDLVNLAMVLASERWQDLCSRTLRTLSAEDLYLACRDRLRPAPERMPADPASVGLEHVERAWAYLVVSWQGLNGIAGTNTYNQHWSVRWTPGGGRWGWQRVPETIPWWHQRLRHVTILCRDAFEVLPKIRDEPGVALYIDPPYVAKSDHYLHDFLPEDHERLARALGRFRKARIVVSYYDDPLIRRLYAGWTIRRVASARKNLIHSAGNGIRGRQEAPELLILNGPSRATSQGSLLEGEP